MNDLTLLIVNADDFGLAAGVNQGVAEAFDRGIVRSASLLAGGGFAEDAARIARERPGLGVGVHLALTQVQPVLAAAKLSGLLAGGQLMPAGPRHLLPRLLTGKIQKAEIIGEYSAQVEKVMDLGVKITHLDSHQHLNLLPVVREAFVEVARKYSIRRMRMPRLAGPSRSGREWIKAMVIDAARIASPSTFVEMVHPRHFWGLACSGDLTRSRLLKIIAGLQPGTHELMTHPAAFDQSMREAYQWDYHWEDELAALCDPAVLELIKAKAVQLGNFSQLND